MFAEIFEELMNKNLVQVNIDDIIDVVGSVHKDIAREAVKISETNDENSIVVSGLITPWGRYWVSGSELNYEFIPDDMYDEALSPWESFEGITVGALPWLSLATKEVNADVDFGEIFATAFAVAMGKTVEAALDGDATSVPLPLADEIGKYEIVDGEVRFAAGKELKQIIKDDLAAKDCKD